MVDSPESTNYYFINKIGVQLTIIHQVGREIPENIQIKLYFSHETVANLKNVHIIQEYAYLKNIVTTVNNIFQWTFMMPLDF